MSRHWRDLVGFAAGYYQRSLGEVALAALPPQLRELDADAQKVIRARRRGAVYPYEIIPLLTRNPDRLGEPGTFTEYDLDAEGRPVVVQRPPGGNSANIVLGVVSTKTERHPEGMSRVVPTHQLNLRAGDRRHSARPLSTPPGRCQ